MNTMGHISSIAANARFGVRAPFLLVLSDLGSSRVELETGQLVAGSRILRGW
jgi:hypothetical protein